MRPILYSADERAFDTNGIGVLVDVLSWNVVEELNGSFELSLRYPTNGIHYKNLVNRAIILAKPNPVADPQPFRIYRRIPSSNGTVTVRARHIAYDLSGNTVDPFRAVGAAAALAALKANSTPQCLFDFWTDKAAGSEMVVQKPATIWSLLGGTKGSVLDCFGGEYEFDRFTVKLFTHRGSDQGVSIRYGKNLVSLEQDENCANCYTGIYPFWASADEASAELVLLPERTVNAQGNFGYTRILPVDFSSEWLEAPTEDMLRARAERYIEENQIGVPNVSLTVQHVSLDQTAEYAGRIPLERVLLGDSVSVFFPELDISSSARAVETDYDVLGDTYNNITIGSVKSSLATTIVQQQKETQEKPGVGMTQRIAASLAAAMMGAHGGAVRLLDTNGDGLPDEFYIADAHDPAEAKKVWRWNYLGWAASESGYNGPFVMGATFKDGILAHMIKAANLIAGTISSADGSTFFLDLDNGVLKGNFSELSIKSGPVLAAPKISGQGTQVVTVENALKDSIQGLTIYGKTTQSGTPTPSTPAAMESVGDSGSIIVNVTDGTNVQTLTASTPNGLHSIGDVKDEIDFARGVRVQRVYMLDLGSLDWSYNYGVFYSSVFSPASRIRSPGLCNCFTVASKAYTELAENEMTIFDPDMSGSARFVVRSSVFGSEKSFAESMRGQTVLYELATPIETPLSAEEMAAFGALGNPAGNVTVYSEAELSIALSGSASSNSMEKAQQEIAVTKEQITEMSLRADGIDMSVSEVRTTAQIAQNAAGEATAAVESASTTYQQRADGVDIAVKELRQVVGTKADQAQVNEITEHFRFDADGMTITNSATGMGINVSEQQVAFTGGKDPITVITPNAMETRYLTVETRLDVGGFSLIPRSNRNLSVRWTGG